MILVVDKVLKIDGFTVTVGVVAETEPPAPMHVSVYVKLPGPVGTTVAVPFTDWLPVKPPPIAPDVIAEHDVA
jgi:hypothetical protein